MAVSPEATIGPNHSHDSRRGAVLIGLYAFLALYLVPVFPHAASANGLTRWATTASLVEKGSFELSWTEPLVGGIVDTAAFEQRVYSNKAPAPAILGVPAYLLARLFVGPPDASNMRVSWTMMRWLLATLPLFLLALWMWRKGASTLVLAVLLFATPLFLYSLLLFSHALAAVAVYASYRLLFGKEEPPGLRAALLAGGFAGLAVTSEFPAAIPAAVFGGALLVRGSSDLRERTRTAAFFLLGGIPFALGLSLYNARLFGSPFSFSYAHENFTDWAEVAQRGVMGIGWPTAHGAFTLLFSPSRGLFFCAPILLVAAFHLFRQAGPERFRRNVRLAAVAITALALAGHGAPHGGWAAGPRYLVLILPLLVEVLQERAIPPLLAGLAFGSSFLLAVIPALTFPFAPPEFSFPQHDFFAPLLFGDGWLTPTLGALAGLGSGMAAALPALACLAVVPVLVLLASERRYAFLAGLATATALVLGLLFFPGLDDESGRLRRATIAERFFRPGERLEPFRRSAETARNARELRRLAALDRMIADARGHAPDDWPYAQPAPLVEGPTAREERARDLLQRGDAAGAEAVLRRGIEELPFARCELAANLAVVLYGAGRKEDALRELQSTSRLVRAGSSAGCCRALYLLGSLLKERNEPAGAEVAFRRFLDATEGAEGSEVNSTRQAASRALAAFRAPLPESAKGTF